VEAGLAAPTNRPDKAYRPESNIPARLNGIAEIIPYRLFRVVAFDIGSADLNRGSINQNLDSIIGYLQNIDDAAPRITIRGLASQSRLPGEGGFTYGWKRAKAIERYFRDHGIPGRMIGQVTSDGDIYSPPGDSPPEVKAWWRTATIEIILSGRPKPGPPYEGGSPPDPPLPPNRKGLKDLPRTLNPEAFMEEAAKSMVVDLPKEINYANVAGGIETCRNTYYTAYARVLADLTEEDPRDRHVDRYYNQPRWDLYQLCNAIVMTPSTTATFPKLLSRVVSTAQRNAVDWVASMGQGAYEVWAKYAREISPDWDSRFHSFLPYP
jgi:hypothetical protein